jgi:hypothetical protein
MKNSWKRWILDRQIDAYQIAEEQMARDEFVELTGEIRHETDLAVLFFDGETEVWLPRSQIEIDGRGLVTVTVPEWLAKDKGLI